MKNKMKKNNQKPIITIDKNGRKKIDFTKIPQSKEDARREEAAMMEWENRHF